MPDLRHFPPRSEPRCCGTCARWREELRPIWPVRRSAPWCIVLSLWLPADLTACGCDAWSPELYETAAVELWEELTRDRPIQTD